MSEPENILGELAEMAREAEEVHEQYLDLKEKAKQAKDRWDGLVLNIQKKLRGLNEVHPLFDRGDDPPADDSGGGGWGGGGGGPDGPASPPPAGPDGVIDVDFEVRNPQLPAPTVIADPRPAVPAAFLDESWRSVSLDALSDHGLSDKLIEHMAESGLKTMGDLANYSNAGNRLTDIAGIGESRADEIESATDEFWAAWRQRDAAKSGDLVTSRPGAWVEEPAEEKPKKARKKRAS